MIVIVIVIVSKVSPEKKIFLQSNVSKGTNDHVFPLVFLSVQSYSTTIGGQIWNI
jgi:hypothetical protein